MNKPDKYGVTTVRCIRTHKSDSRVAVRGLGTIIQRIFLPNQDLVRLGTQGLFHPFLKTFVAFSPAPTDCP